MRQIVVNLTVLLAVTGLIVGFAELLKLGDSTTRMLSLVHYWGGLLFLVMFPLYAWDHIRANRHWLRKTRLTTVTGAVQTLVAAVLMLSGLVLIVYGVAVWSSVRAIHHWLTYPMAALLLAHYLSRKDWRP